MPLLQIFVWLCIVGAFIVLFRYWSSFWQEAHWILPYITLGLLFTLLAAALKVPLAPSLFENFRLVFVNVVRLLRDAFFGVAGLVLFRKEGSLRPLQRWDEGFAFLREVPTQFLLSVMVGYIAYTMLLFHLFAPGVFAVKAGSLPGVLSSLSLTAVLAIDEELMYRLYLMGFIVFTLQGRSYRWMAAILVSALIWSFAHWFIKDLGLIKVAHVLPMGLILGYTLKKYGFETCVLLHVTLNIVNGLIAELL